MLNATLRRTSDLASANVIEATPVEMVALQTRPAAERPARRRSLLMDYHSAKLDIDPELIFLICITGVILVMLTPL